ALHFPEGTTVDVGTSIIAVDVSGGAAPAEEAAPPAPDTAAEPEPEPEPKGSGRQPVLVGYGVATSSTRRRPRKPAAGAQPELNGHSPAPDAAAKPAPAPTPAAGPGDWGRRPRAKPSGRKRAKDHGVDRRTVVPTGPDGISTRDHVHAAARPRAPE